MSLTPLPFLRCAVRGHHHLALRRLRTRPTAAWLLANRSPSELNLPAQKADTAEEKGKRRKEHGGRRHAENSPALFNIHGQCKHQTQTDGINAA